MQIFRKWYIVVLVVLILLLIGANLKLNQIESDPASQAENPFANLFIKVKNGSPVPDFELSTVKGEKIRIDQYRGKPVVLNFWATWCAPCVSEMPLLQAAAEHHPDDLVVLGINAQEPVNIVAEFVKKYRVSFPIILDADGKIGNKFGAFAYPVTFFIDKEGIIRSQHIGQLNEETLQKNLEIIGIKSW